MTNADLDPIEATVDEIRKESESLQSEASRMKFRHHFFTVTTILLGVAAPAFVSYTPPKDFNEVWWKLLVIAITAFATASATLRTVLRFGDRFSNSALTAIAMDELCAELCAKRFEVLHQVKEEFVQQKLFEFASWGKKQMYTIKKAYVEKEVAATTKDRIELVQAPAITHDQKADPTKKST